MNEPSGKSDEPNIQAMGSKQMKMKNNTAINLKLRGGIKTLAIRLFNKKLVQELPTCFHLFSNGLKRHRHGLDRVKIRN